MSNEMREWVLSRIGDLEFERCQARLYGKPMEGDPAALPHDHWDCEKTCKECYGDEEQ